MLMRTPPRTGLVALAITALASGLLACGGESDSGNDPRSQATPAIEFQLDELPEVAGENKLLPGDLQDFEPVDGETYTLQGRIRETNRGLNVVVIVDDTRAHYEPDRPEPWTYCCTDPTVLRDNSIVVRFVRPGQQMPERIAPQSKPAYRLIDLITVVGSFLRNEQGQLVFLATGYVLDERPELGDHVQWPTS